MDVAEDLDALLEEFSRLKRLDNFPSAEQYFHDVLEPYADLLPVIIEYMDMLVKQGSYSRANQFMTSERTIASIQKAEQPVPDAKHQTCLYLTTFGLMDSLSRLHSEGQFFAAYNVVRNMEIKVRPILGAVQEPMSQDPAQIQITRYALKILSHIESEIGFVQERHFDYWSNWSQLYEALVREGRIWDARDIILASLESEGAHNTWGMIFNDALTSPSPFKQLFSDWNIANYDDATYLAILDIIVATSRPYLRWVLAEEDLQRKCNEEHTDLQIKLRSYPGLTVWPNALPIYVPINGESPTDSLQEEIDKEVSTASNEAIESVLYISREAQDYETEVICLRELLYRSKGQKQEESLTRLQNLQGSLQGDSVGQQRTNPVIVPLYQNEASAPSFVRGANVSEKRYGRDEKPLPKVDGHFFVYPLRYIEDHLRNKGLLEAYGMGYKAVTVDIGGGDYGILEIWGARSFEPLSSLNRDTGLGEEEAKSRPHIRDSSSGSYERTRPETKNEKAEESVYVDPYEID
ncbi:hypothetical protein BDV19DRAFT_385684 [Aspergillus venezuelensis]